MEVPGSPLNREMNVFWANLVRRFPLMRQAGTEDMTVIQRSVMMGEPLQNAIIQTMEGRIVTRTHTTI